MTETLHWYAETSGGVQTGNCTVTENGGALHLTADLPAGTLKTVRAELPWSMEADERLFMNGYQTWTYSPELNRNGKLRGTDHIPGFLRKKFSSTQVFHLSLLLALCGYGTLLVFCLTGLSHSLALLCIPGVVVFACNGMLTVLTTLFLSNSVDYGQLKTGRREESVIFSMQTFVVKAASGVAVFLTGIGLDLIGLVGNTEETGPVAVQSAGTLLGLRLMMTVLPMLVLAGALVLFRRKFVLTDARAAEISAQLHGEEAHHD